MASWEEELHNIVLGATLDKFKSILARDEVKRNGNFGRNEWKENAAPLHEAAYYGYVDKIQILVDAGFKIDSFLSGYSNLTALHWAVNNDQVASVKLLLKLGANHAFKGKWGIYSGTPLDFARDGGNVEIEKILLEHHKFIAAAEQFKGMEPIGKIKTKNFKKQELVAAFQVQDNISKKAKQKEELDMKMKQLGENVKDEKKLQQRRLTKAKAEFENEDRKLQAKSKEFQALFEEEKRKLELRLEIQLKEVEAAKIKLKNNLATEEKNIKAKITSDKKEHDTNKAKLELEKQKLINEMQALESQTTYKTEAEIHLIQEQLVEIETLILELRDVFMGDKNDCPVCCELPQEVFSCMECDNWVCRRCKDQLENCPSCRENFGAKPPRRNRAVERMLGNP